MAFYPSLGRRQVTAKEKKTVFTAAKSTQGFFCVPHLRFFWSKLT
jgi:hypothetical protein